MHRKYYFDIIWNILTICETDKGPIVFVVAYKVYADMTMLYTILSDGKQLSYFESLIF